MRVLQRCIYSITSRDEVIIRLGAIGKEKGVPKIKCNYNPAAWMLEVTSMSVEKQLGIDFSQVYSPSSLYRDLNIMVEQLSKPSPSSNSRISASTWVQFTACLRKHHLSYWRSPEYNLRRIFFVFISSLFFGLLFFETWKQYNYGAGLAQHHRLYIYCKGKDLLEPTLLR